MIVRAYTRHLDETAHNEGKWNTQQLERTHVTLRTWIKRLACKTMNWLRVFCRAEAPRMSHGV